MHYKLLPTTYFGPVQWYKELHRSGRVVIDRDEPWVKQTYRNRCVIATAAGRQTLTVPVVHTGQAHTPIRDVRISSHGNWQHLHWQAISSAYGHSPFLQFYEDDLRPFFEKKWEFLFDFNLEIIHKMCELLDIVSSPKEPLLAEVSSFGGRLEGALPSGGGWTTLHLERPYWQVFQQRHGFQPNLSILDLLLCMGNEAIFYL